MSRYYEVWCEQGQLVIENIVNGKAQTCMAPRAVVLETLQDTDIPDQLPTGWAWVDENHHRVPRDSVGAWDEKHNILVYVEPPPWTCPWCGTKERMSSSCMHADFLGESDRRAIYDKWVKKTVEQSIMKMHGYGAPKAIFDLVWDHYLETLENGFDT